MSNLTEDEFVRRCLAAQKPGAGLKELGAKKFYLLLWGATGEWAVRFRTRRGSAFPLGRDADTFVRVLFSFSRRKVPFTTSRHRRSTGSARSHIVDDVPGPFSLAFRSSLPSCPVSFAHLHTLLPPFRRQVQDWITENAPSLDPEVFCPPPLRGKTIIEMGVSPPPLPALLFSPP